MKGIPYRESLSPVDSVGTRFRKNAFISREYILLALLCLVSLAVAIFIAQRGGWLVNNDFFTFWGGGRGLLDGQNLYDPTAWREIHEHYGSSWVQDPIFIYGPPTAIFFAPISALPISLASVVWLTLCEWGIVLAGYILVRKLESSSWKRFALTWAIGIAGFLPVILVLTLGQTSVVLLVSVVASAVLFNRGNWFRGGLILGLVAVKPMPLILFIPAIGLWLAIHRHWRGVAGLLASFILVPIASLGLYPNLLSTWQAVMLGRVGSVGARMATMWGLSSDLFGKYGTSVGIGLAILLIGVAIYIAWQWRGDALTLVGALIPLSLLVAPYLWTYDQILLIVPLLLALVRFRKRGVPFWIVAIAPIAIALLDGILFAFEAIRLSETLTVLLTLAVGTLFLISTRERIAKYDRI